MSTAIFQPIDETPKGIIAYLRMPLACSALLAMDKFVEKAYGKGCVMSENPKGWLMIQSAVKESK